MAYSFILGASAIMSVVILLSFCPVPTVGGDYILDIHGDKVVNSMDYYIMPQLYGPGGLTLAPLRNTTSVCPEYMLKNGQDYSVGSTFSIVPVSTSTQYLTTGQPVAFYFKHTTTAATTTCSNLMRWLVHPNDQSYVIVSVDDFHALQFNSTYYFTIQLTKESKYGYHIKFCLNDNCNDLGFVNGVLGVNPNDPFAFVFLRRGTECKAPGEIQSLA